MYLRIFGVGAVFFSLSLSLMAFSESTLPTDSGESSKGLGAELAVTNPDPGELADEPVSGTEPEDDTPVVLESMEIKYGELGRRPWQAPKYESQTGVLGYESGTFEPPVGLEPQVKFWIEIFTQFTTDQGVLHDSRYIDIVYEKIDFKKIENYAQMNPFQQQRARERLVKAKKKEVVSRLLALSSLKEPTGLEGEDLRYWQMFDKVDEPKKFREAAARGRLRFQLGQKDRFVQGIYYSGRYLEKMEEIFKSEGLPVELTRLPFVESSFNLKARSKVGASGIWQFMRYTGRMYMKVGSLVDERNDPIVSTRAAARLLRFNYNLLQSWPLAVTAYNFGPAGMKREKDRLKTDNLVEIAQRSKSRRFGFASSNFYASFLAVLEVEKNAGKYFGKVDWSNSLKYDEIILPKPVKFQTLIEHFSGNTDQTLLFNPHFSSVVRKGYVALPKGTLIRVPEQTADRLMAAIESQPKPTARALPAGLAEYRVSPGDTLSSIAQTFGVSISVIQEINGISNPRRLKTGQRLQIPVSGR